MNVGVIGAQWGDEGKGKIVDLLAPHFSIVARYQGGHNAGHTIYTDGRKFVHHLVPSGILHPGVTCVLGSGVVVDPQALQAELATLAAAGILVDGRLLISDRAHLILPYHRELEALAEARRGEHRIGTTSRGIGPAYEDKVGRRGIRIADLAGTSAELLFQAVRENVAIRNRLIGDPVMDAQPVLEELHRTWTWMRRSVVDVSRYLSQAAASGRTILFEGAQGTLLDIDHGTYPYVTSSNATTGGICTGLGVPPKMIGSVLGIAKAYTTRVGEGPLPTEVAGELGDRLRESGQEYGASTGRPRRCGWYDAVAVRYATRINGLDALALTKLDVLDGFDEISVCTAYRSQGQILEDLPADIDRLAACEPVYETLPGWNRPTRGARSYRELPPAAQRYVSKLEETSGCPRLAHLDRTGSGGYDHPGRVPCRTVADRQDSVNTS